MSAPLPHPVAHDMPYPLLGLDISETRIGTAVVDHAQASPQPLFTYQRETRARDLAQCVEWIRRYRIAGVVIGLPLNMDGAAGARANWMPAIQPGTAAHDRHSHFSAGRAFVNGGSQ